MSDTADKFLRLEVLGTVEEKCLSGDTLDLAEFIKEQFVIRSPELKNKVLFQVEAPSASDKDKLWFKKDKNNNPLGVFYYNGDLRKWVNYFTQVDLKERIFYRFDTSQNLADMPFGYQLDDELENQRVFDEDGKIKYAWLKVSISPI